MTYTIAVTNLNPVPVFFYKSINIQHHYKILDTKCSETCPNSIKIMASVWKVVIECVKMYMRVWWSFTYEYANLSTLFWTPNIMKRAKMVRIVWDQFDECVR